MMMRIEVNYTRTNIFGIDEIITDTKMNATYTDLCEILNKMSHTEEADKYGVNITFDKRVKECTGISFFYNNKYYQNNKMLTVTYYYEDDDFEEYIWREFRLKTFIREALNEKR